MAVLTRRKWRGTARGNLRRLIRLCDTLLALNARHPERRYFGPPSQAFQSLNPEVLLQKLRAWSSGALDETVPR